MFKCDYTKLTLSFNNFHDLKVGDQPDYGEFCLLELKDGRHTGGSWCSKGDGKSNIVEGEFIRGTADTVDASEVSKWHELNRYNASNCMDDDSVEWINVGPEKEDAYSLQLSDFKSTEMGEFPREEQYCFLILTDGSLAVGRWNEYSSGDGAFIYAPALSSYSMDKVWVWAPLSNDDVFDREEEARREREHEDELNRNPTVDPKLFRYGTDIKVYYEKACEKLKKDYPWASVEIMKKKQEYVIAPRHGKYVFGRDDGTYDGRKVIWQWNDGTTSEEFIDFLCDYTRDTVKNNNPDEKFSLGLDIEPYLKKAYENVKRDYTWFEESMITTHYAIEKCRGELEFTVWYKDGGEHFVCDCAKADDFIESVEHDYQEAALRANPVVGSHSVPVSKVGHVDMHGWNLENYTFYKLKTGDYKVSVTAGDRVAGGSREFFIMPSCFEAKTYGEFLDRYLEIVSASFGLAKENLMKDEELKKFLGFKND